MLSNTFSNPFSRTIVQICCWSLLATLMVESGYSQIILNPNPTVRVPDVMLFPNQANQYVDIYVTDNAPLGGLNFSIILGDGFPDLAGSTIDGPIITDVDLIGTLLQPTVFTGNNTGQQDPGSKDRVAFRNTTTQSGTVSEDGRLAILTIDTTGYFSGTYDLLVDGLNASPSTELLAATGEIYQTQFRNGSITLTAVPEPVHYALASGLFCLVFAFWRKKSNAKQQALAASFFVALMSLPMARAQGVIDVGSHILPANSARHALDLYIEGDMPVSGANLIVEIRAHPNMPPTTKLPVLREVDLEGKTEPTIFTPNRTRQTSAEGRDWIRIESVTTSQGSVAAQGRIARLIIDTEGIHQGFFQLMIAGTIAGDSEVIGIDAQPLETQLHNGMIVIYHSLKPGLVWEEPLLLPDSRQGVHLVGKPNRVYVIQETVGLGPNSEWRNLIEVNFTQNEWYQFIPLPKVQQRFRLIRALAYPVDLPSEFQ